jgi:hypothetical protein
MHLDSSNKLSVGGPISAGPSQTSFVVPSNQSILTWNLTTNGDTSFVNARGSGYGEFDWYIAGPGTTINQTTIPNMKLDSASALHLNAGPAVAASNYGFTYSQPALASGQIAWITTGLNVSTAGQFVGLGYNNAATPTGAIGMIAGGLAHFDFPGNWTFPATVTSSGGITAPNITMPSTGFIGSAGGNLVVQASSPSAGVLLNWNSGSTGGTVFGNGSGTTVASISSTGVISGTAKNFKIVHPLDDTKLLVHSCIEGPEHAVFYRGEGETSGGIASITLPDYFEALTMPEGRTVQLTERIEDDPDPTFGGFLAAGRVKDGKFTVRSSNPITKFYWEVKAIRSDIEELEIVTERTEEGMHGRKKGVKS